MSLMSSKRLQKLDIRRLWLPKLREVPTQCLSCPFLEGNDTAFGKIVRRIFTTYGLPSRAPLDTVRRNIRLDLTLIQCSGDFACHNSVYDPKGKMRPRREHRQCLGASKWWRGE